MKSPRKSFSILRLDALILTLLVVAWIAFSSSAPDTDAWYEERVTEWAEGHTPASYTQMRRQNPEWDFMARTFLVLTLTEHALADPEETERAKQTIDAIIADTLAQEALHGPSRFLLSYWFRTPLRGNGRSLFVDGELLVMMGARRMIDDDAWQTEMSSRAALVASSLGAGSALPIAESYPDEGWLFCHAMAMVGLRMHEVLDDADHAALKSEWLAAIRSELVHPETGMLVSEFNMDGIHHDGPEGSSIWAVAVALQLLDPELARQQYELARQHLGGSVLMMGYAREWPRGHEGPIDIDSGPLVPFIDASASSSGFALLASQAFGSKRWNRQLHRALAAAFLVMKVDPFLAAAADNPVGQSVVLWGLSFGPLWERLGA